MSAWDKKTPTHELRWRRERFVRVAEGGGYEPWYRDTLQQKWKVTRGGAGNGLKETEEWIDVPVEDEED